MARDKRGSELARLTDAELVRAVALADLAPMEVLYERHGAAAFALARRILGSQARAEDAVQEAYFNLWRGAARYDSSRGSVRSWLLAMVRNRSIDALRRLDVRERRRVGMEGLEDRIAADEQTGADLAVRRDEARAVRRALATLPREQRRPLELAYFGGWTQREIAEHLGVPLGTVKSRIRLGLAKLRAALAELADSVG